MAAQPSDPRVLAAWPTELASLPFGSPEFKAANAHLADEDEAACAPFSRAMPPWINLTSTTVCNLKCFMCNQFLDPDSPSWIMEDAVYDRVVRELYPYAKTMQLSAFGEPLMTPQIDRKLDDLEAHGVKLDMVSNGTLMMKESRFREQLLRNLEEVTFSLDGATAATYESVRVGARFHEVHDNITRFAEARMAMPADQRPKLYFNYILMKRTVAEAPTFVEQVKRWGGDGITFNHLVSFHPSLRSESLNYHRAWCNEWLDRTRAALRELSVPAMLPPNFAVTEAEPPVTTDAESRPSPAPPVRSGPPPKKCMFLWRRVYVGPNGDVVPCNLAGMPNFGNLTKEPFFDIWNGETYREYRAHVFTSRQLGKCRNCYQVWQTPELAGAEGFEYLMIRILVEPSDHRFRNQGDAAMICAALDRLRDLWPHASIQVLTEDPVRMLEYCQSVEPLSVEGRRAWVADLLPERYVRWLPGALLAGARGFERILRRRWPRCAGALVRARLWARGRRGDGVRAFLEAVSSADLVVATGMGGLTDAFPSYARALLETFELALEAGAVTALMGQGIGPLNDPRLRAQVARVLSRVDLIALRERHTGGPLLDALGVRPERVMTTGDDAVELAYRRRAKGLGDHLGINLRVSSYSGIDRSHASVIGRVLEAAARRHRTALAVAPISRYPGEDDVESVASLLGPEDDRGAHVDTPQAAIEQVGRCRVLVSGSYHAAVFALSQGIPAVGVVQSDDVNKFMGLIDQFGAGCRMTRLSDPDFEAKLASNIDEAWRSAEQARPALLAAAALQIDLGKAAYRRLHDLVATRRR